jgi:hypothetical protein
MPESVTNRCTKAHEYVFMLAKRGGYFCDMEAIKTDADPATRVITGKSGSYGQAVGRGVKPSGNGVPGSVMSTGDKANKRSVWHVGTAGGYAGAHFATFPSGLIEPMILCGSSEYGCCDSCGSPWERVVDVVRGERDTSRGGNCLGKQSQNAEGTGAEQKDVFMEIKGATTLGWQPTCGCGTRSGVRPCVVIDPFIGSGTTCAVSLSLGRSSIGIDLNEQYLREHAVGRIVAAANGPRRTRGEMRKVGRAVPVTPPPVVRVKLGR